MVETTRHWQRVESATHIYRNRQRNHQNSSTLSWGNQAKLMAFFHRQHWQVSYIYIHLGLDRNLFLAIYMYIHNRYKLLLCYIQIGIIERLLHVFSGMSIQKIWNNPQLGNRLASSVLVLWVIYRSCNSCVRRVL